MIQLIGIKDDTALGIREKLAIKASKQEFYLNKFKEFAEGILILSTCNRTEIYFNSSYEKEEILRKVFDELEWNLEFKDYVFYKQEEDVHKHLMDVVCGFRSRILGEDQILGQVKNAYAIALKEDALCNRLQRLFQVAITCGKKFRTQCKMYEIPVSSASIVSNMAIKEGKKKIMVLGFGEIGKAVCTNLLGNKSVECIYVVVRNKSVLNEINDNRVRALSFGEKDRFIKDVQCIIGATSAPHSVIRKEFVEEQTLIFDLAVPRDVDKNVRDIEGVKLYDIDEISLLDDENKKLRLERMNSNKLIIEDALREYYEWEQLRDISALIKQIKIRGNEIWQERLESFKNKSHNEYDDAIAEKLLKSIVNTYTNRAIDLLKEETLKGSDDQCLRVIKKIFLEN